MIEVEEEVEVEVEEQVEVDIEDDDDDDDNEEEAEKKKKKKKKKKTKKTKMITKIIKKKIETTHVDPNENMNLLKVDDTYINTWSTYFQQHARVAPYLSSNTANDLEKAFKFSNVKETSVQTFV